MSGQDDTHEDKTKRTNNTNATRLQTKVRRKIIKL